jgi:hypothetical protein
MAEKFLKKGTTSSLELLQISNGFQMTIWGIQGMFFNLGN